MKLTSKVRSITSIGRIDTMKIFWVIQDDSWPAFYFSGVPSERYISWTVKLENAFFFTSEADADRFKWSLGRSGDSVKQVEISVTLKD